MKLGDFWGALDLGHRRSLRLGLLLLSSLFIIGATALVYARLIYERALSVGGAGGVVAGSGSTAVAGASSSAALVVLVISAVIIGLSVFGFLRERFARTSNAEPVSTVSEISADQESMSPSLPLKLHSAPGEDWEESPRNEEEEEQ